MSLICTLIIMTTFSSITEIEIHLLVYSLTLTHHANSSHNNNNKKQ